MKKILAGLTVMGLVFSGCATGGEGGLSERESGALLGSGLGAGTGAIIGAQTGHAGAGTAIGAGIGALGGALMGEASRRNKEQTKKEIRQEMMQQQYQPQYAAQPYSGTAPPPPQPTYTPQPTYAPQPTQELNTKYNPRTGQTFPERYKFDPNTGEELKYLR